MKRIIPTVILALLVPMGLGAPPARAEPKPAAADEQTEIGTVMPRNGNVADPNVVHVNWNGSLDDTCGSSDAPCRTISKGISRAADDSIVVVAPGTYPETFIRIPKAVTISGPNATIPGNGDRIPEAIVKAAMLPDVDGITITGLTIDGTGVDQTPVLQKRGILIANTNKVANTTITNNIIEDWVTGISLAGSTSPGWVNNATITGNKLINNGIGSTDNATNLTITGNTFVNGGVGLGSGAGLKVPISGNDFSGATSSRYFSSAAGVMDDTAFFSVLTGNTFDKAAAVNSATGDWYQKAIFPTITGALKPAVSGATIRVAPGVYQEQVEITKSVNLLGPFDDTSPWKYGTTGAMPTQWDDSSTWATIAGPSGSATRAIDIRAGVDGAVIRGFALDAKLSAWGLYAYRSSGVTLQNNFIWAKNDTAVMTHGTADDTLQGWTVDSNLIVGDEMPANKSGINFQGPVQGLAVTNNRIVMTGRGVQISAGAGVVRLADNDFEDIALRGIQLAGVWASDTSVSITGNDFVNVNYAGDAPDANKEESDSGIIRTYDSGTTFGENTTLNIENNSFEQTDTAKLGSGIVFQVPTPGPYVPFDRVFIRNNSMALPPTAKSIAIYARVGQPETTLVAEPNYWGPYAVTRDAIAATIWHADDSAKLVSVDFVPWIVDFDDTVPRTRPGFFPNNVVLSSDVPDQPTAVFATAGDQQASVSWTAPAAAKSLTGYKVTAVEDPAKTCETTAIPPSAPATTCFVTGLTNGTAYTFTVTATNAAGTGVPSDASVAVIPRTVPGAPSGVGAVAGNRSATVTWTAPTNNGGSAITGYTVTASPGGATCTTTGATSCVVNGLTNGTPYTFTVTATNAAGTGQASQASNAVTPFAPIPPGPDPTPNPSPTPTPTPTPSPTPTPVPVPTPLPPGEAEVIVDGQPQTVVVEPQPDDAGLNVTGEGFELQLDAAAPNGTEVPVRTEDGRAVLVLETEGFARSAGTGFQPGSETYVWLFSEPTLLGSIPVDAQGRFVGEVSLPVDIGPGEHMLQVTGTTPTGATRALVLGVVVQPAAVPGAPTNVAPVPGNRQVALTWIAPVRPGASPITGYRIEQSRNGGPWTVAIANTGSARPNAGTNAVVARLVNGDDYRFRVTAINADGLGRTSEPSASTTPEAPEGRSILIVGQRATIKGKSGIRVRGETTGFTRKAILRPWTRFPGDKAFAEGRDRIRLNGKGTFTWQRQTKKSITVYIQAGDGTRSNRVVIPAR